MNKNIFQTVQIDAPYRSNPAATFYELCGNKKISLLLESAEINKKYQLKSMMIIDTAVRITAYKQIVIYEAMTKNGQNILDQIHTVIPKVVRISYYKNTVKLIFPKNDFNVDEDVKLRSLSVFDAFRFIFQLVKAKEKDLDAIFFGGLFSYDLINTFEILPKVKGCYKCPDFCFYLSEVLLIIDHLNKNSMIQGSIFFKDFYEQKRITDRLYNLQKKLYNDPTNIPCNTILPSKVQISLNDLEYQNVVKNMQRYIRQGEIFQVVPSRKFFLSCPYPLLAYYTLKLNNPSPYMFFMQDTDFTLFGASPESSLKYNPITRKIEIYPIAGTRPRGFDLSGNLNFDFDSRIELEMRTNHKELSEHLMLVDLARNDLAKICVPGTRFVSQLTKVDRYSHVMHLVSKVIGVLQYDLDALHAYSACMNMGTLTGAPKMRAMELIYEAENFKRGSYGGAIGYFTASGVLDTCIVIRSAYVENNIATIQAGAGVVLDSIPIEEAIESRNKAQVVLNSIIQSNYHKDIL
ncbi:anthranilate synthase component 1 [Buchnera aphidicola (Sarucallis kahawaluokalani)]|uniref:Anthranilate synthase component 1 n=2 Tax=Buchnera aphidicola TaxID=9 RepID=A0A4D6YMB3_9GAMM|nr:anthranilate synthase component 1 [Buchnera aphidicola]QCI26165.1 anthranilate synthase component 1 [Buchnera aphidicola (Sarucallis kahawaluokalani)]